MVRENRRPGAAEQAAPGFLRLAVRIPASARRNVVPRVRISSLQGGWRLLGAITYDSGGTGRPRRTERYGLPLLEVSLRPCGWRERGRVRAAARRLGRQGIVRVLAPPEFLHWELLEARGLRQVDPLPFLRFYAGELALAALRREGVAPQRGTVALRGRRVDRDMVRAAEFLCPRVRELAVSARQGGEELSAWLRREYGMPVRPDGEGVTAAVRFDETAPGGGGRELSLYGGAPRLAGVCPRAAALEEGDREDLPLLAALWETGRLEAFGLEFT